jgi:hypothetical protein
MCCLYDMATPMRAGCASTAGIDLFVDKFLAYELILSGIVGVHAVILWPFYTLVAV